MEEIKQLEKLVEERKKQARDRKLHDKLIEVFNNNETTHYIFQEKPGIVQDLRSYENGELLIHKITRTKEFVDAYGKYSSSSSACAEIMWLEKGFYKVVYRELYYPLWCAPHFPIDVYIPGSWEKELERLYQEIMFKRKKGWDQQRERERIREAEEKKKRISGFKNNFGL